MAWAGAIDAKVSACRMLCQTLGPVWFEAHMLGPPSGLGGGQGRRGGLEMRNNMKQRSEFRVRAKLGI